MSNHMPRDRDPRIPVRLLGTHEAPPAGAAILAEGEPPPALPPGQPAARFDLPATGHAIGCACCAPRNPAALALNRLFLSRVRGEAPFFAKVAAIPRSAKGAAAIRDALSGDPVVQARFRAG
jgi:hypothetical protein